MSVESRRAAPGVFFLSFVLPEADSTISALDRAAVTYSYGEFQPSVNNDRRAYLGIWPFSLVLPGADGTISGTDRARVTFAYYEGDNPTPFDRKLSSINLVFMP